LAKPLLDLKKREVFYSFTAAFFNKIFQPKVDMLKLWI